MDQDFRVRHAVLVQLASLGITLPKIPHKKQPSKVLTAICDYIVTVWDRRACRCVAGVSWEWLHHRRIFLVPSSQRSVCVFSEERQHGRVWCSARTGCAEPGHIHRQAQTAYV